MATVATDLEELLLGVPAGMWVAISERQHKVIAVGDNAPTVYRSAESQGEPEPLIVRVPDRAEAMFL